MTVQHALYSAISGLQANAHGMSVISNNIANSSTYGFKSDRAEFQDLLSISLNEHSQVGRGATLRNIKTIFNQGALSHTGQTLDLSIQGNGFFAVKSQKQEVEDPSGYMYTRDGTFNFDYQGFIVDADGNRVQGYMPDSSGKLSNVVSDLRISAKQVEPQATSLVSLAVNLDSRAGPLAQEFSLEKPSATSNYSTAVPVYDTLGQAHNLNLYFRRNAENPKIWDWYATLPAGEVQGAEVQTGEDGEAMPHLVHQGQLEFAENGRPVLNYQSLRGDQIYYDELEKTDAFELQFSNGSKAQNLQLNFGPEWSDTEKEVGTFTATNMAGDFAVLYHQQNGYESGSLKTIRIEHDGHIHGTYSNGKSLVLGSLAIANFNNIHGLEKLGGNKFGYQPGAGNVSMGLPQSMDFGSIYSSSLEEANVDLTNEFVEMITTQRAFQANSRAVRTSDSLLEEILSLKY